MSFALICVLACALSFSSCKKNDDEWIKTKTDDFEKRIAALETWQHSANSDITSSCPHAKDGFYLPESLQEMGADAFGFCKSIERVGMGATQLKTIPDRAFLACDNLYQALFPDGLESIGEYAFAETHIERLEFPKSLKTIFGGAFDSTPVTLVYCYGKTAPVLEPTVRGVTKFFSPSVKENVTLRVPKGTKSQYDAQWSQYFKEIKEM